MNGIIKNFQLGSLTLPNNIFYAPLAGCSDFPFRKMVQRFNPGLMFCEMVKMEALIRHEPNTYRLLDFSKDMHPIGGQICGANPKIAGQAAKIIEDLGFDVVDLNCGCPVDKVTKDGSGSGLLKSPEKIGEIINQMRNAVNIPVMLKIRAGWDDDHINATEVTKIAEDAGAVSICIHGRTRKQAYKGPSNWDHIKDAKQSATKIKIIGNGDIFDVESALGILDHTGCDAILISRGSMGQPWLSNDILDYVSDGIEHKRDNVFYIEKLIEHFSFILAYQTGKKAALDMKRVGSWYLKRCPQTKDLRMQLMKMSDPFKMKQHVEHYLTIA